MTTQYSNITGQTLQGVTRVDQLVATGNCTLGTNTTDVHTINGTLAVTGGLSDPGGINATAIGAVTPSTGAFTTFTSTGLADLSGASAGQIKFPVTQNASADVNTLDDYREGTWTPTGNVITFAAASGSYTKIGRHVTVTYDVTFPATGDTGQARLQSLPFTPAYMGGGSIGYSEAVAATRSYNDTNTFLTLVSSPAGIATNANCTGARIWGTHTFII